VLAEVKDLGKAHGIEYLVAPALQIQREGRSEMFDQQRQPFYSDCSHFAIRNRVVPRTEPALAHVRNGRKLSSHLPELKTRLSVHPTLVIGQL
jgi:hypothetical protein